MQCKWSIILFWVNTHGCLKLTHYSGLYGRVHAASLILGNLVLILGTYMYQGVGTCLEHYDLFLSGEYFVCATKHSHAPILSTLMMLIDNLQCTLYM